MSKILLVEDDNNLREIYEARLQAEGYEIITAQDGEEALAIAIKERPDLIISDVMMPKISGFDMLDILRGTPETRDTKVIMMTALSQAEDKARADKLGADRYLVKSQVTLEDVAKVTKEVLEGVPSSQSSTPETVSSSTTAPATIPGISSPVSNVPVPPADTSSEPSVAPITPLNAPAIDDTTLADAPQTPADSTITPLTITPAPVLPVVEEPQAQAPVAPIEPVLTPLTVAAPLQKEETIESATETATPPVNLPEPVDEPAVELPPLYENSDEAATPPLQPKPLDLGSSSVAMPTAAEPSEDSTAGQSGSPFLVSKPVTEIQTSPATPPAEVDEAAKIADSIESFLSTKAEANGQATPVVMPTDSQGVSPEPVTPTALTEAPSSQVAADPIKSISTHQTTQVPAPDSQEAENAASTLPKSGYKVIQPLSDLSKPPVDLEALAKKEEEFGTAQQIVNTPTTKPGDEPLEKPTPPPAQAGQTIDPTTLAL
ncbi:MAG: response regulator [bacterium]|nr:response regulator [bacterium]